MPFTCWVSRRQKCWYFMELNTGQSFEGVVYTSSKPFKKNLMKSVLLSKRIFRKCMKRDSALAILYDRSVVWSGKMSHLSSWKILQPWVKRFWRHWHFNHVRTLVYEYGLWSSLRHMQIIQNGFILWCLMYKILHLKSSIIILGFMPQLFYMLHLIWPWRHPNKLPRRHYPHFTGEMATSLWSLSKLMSGDGK